MKEHFIEYLEGIGITKTFRKRIEEIYNFYVEICPDDIIDIFVTDYTMGDGSRKYENLWCFSPKNCMEAQLFIENDHFDIAPIENQIAHLEIQKENYDFKEANDKSKLYLSLNFSLSSLQCDFKASKENCTYLKNIIFEHALPNLRK